ncbi:MAG: tRNA lysidine(34) synthetase TilS [Agathobaculum sp.]|uniref:tRNA lysidine(34) synthetase TilS n=1 Tax=Agathobaculum sp. TaxID=2048138 RepID=UPI002A83253B|nr:tRNA lysidine(34) synthetase TilS [Agathobaculum sp.]MDY3711780.1 tRNA lysidine(34) synthetase TilS [Agathobaculum sp.]
MLDTVRRTIADYQMLAPGEPVLCALSGGADSTALLRALLALGYPVRAYHLNHCLRGQEAERDEAFCRALCGALGVPLTAERVDIRGEAARSGQSIETAARRVRYTRLAALAQGGKIATAHTADDQIETMLFHLARGTGPRGLAGIPPVRGQIIRPLIEAERADIEAYLAALGQVFVTDSTNQTDDYTRNRIRHGVVPLLREINPALSDAAARLGRLLRQDDACLTEQARDLTDAAAEGEGAWRVSVLRAAHPAIRSRALRRLAAVCGVPARDFAAVHVRSLEQLLETDDPSAVCSLPYGYRAWREYELLRISRAEMPAPLVEVLLSVPFAGAVWDGRVRLCIRQLEKNEVFYKTFNTFCVDCGTISFGTLCVRPRRTGDRLRLTANGGSRSLKKLMIDRRIPRQRRAQLAVIADENGPIAVQDIGMDIARAPQGGARIEIKIEG